MHNFIHLKDEDCMFLKEDVIFVEQKYNLSKDHLITIHESRAISRISFDYLKEYLIPTNSIIFVTQSLNNFVLFHGHRGDIILNIERLRGIYKIIHSEEYKLHFNITDGANDLAIKSVSFLNTSQMCGACGAINMGVVVTPKMAEEIKKYLLNKNS